MRLVKWMLFGCAFVFLIRETNEIVAAPITPAEEAKLRAISQRARSGEYRALLEAATLPPEVAVPYLRSWTRLTEPDAGPTVETAQQALRQVPGGAKYVAGEIATDLANGKAISNYDAQTLTMIGTPEAQAALAPYLFDFRVKIDGEDDEIKEHLAFATAMWALQSMKIPDAPFGERSRSLTSTRLVAWQKWAIAKGYVPKEWASRVGPPQYLLDFEARTGRPKLEAPPQGGAISNGVVPPELPKVEIPDNSPRPVSKISPVENSESGHVNMRFVVVALVGVVVLVSGAWLIFWRNPK